MDEGTVLVTVSGSRHKIKREEESNMLIIDGNSVYEIDEECLKRRSVPEECEVYKKIVREREAAKNKEKTEKPK